MKDEVFAPYDNKNVRAVAAVLIVAVLAVAVVAGLQGWLCS